MGEQLHIHEFKTRYRLSPRTRDSRTRLDGILHRVMQESLEQAMENLGVAADEELCIRELHSLVRLRLDDSDSSLAKQWSHSLAVSIRQAMAGEDPSGIVLYRSRLHALHDFAACIAQGHLQRAWAWRQLGLIDDAPNLSLSRATDRLVEVMVEQPRQAMPLLISLAGSNHLPALVERMQQVHWQRLSEAVAGILMPATISQAVDSSLAHGPLPRVSSLLWHSTIGRVLLTRPRPFLQAGIALAPVMVIVAAEVEPAVFSRSRSGLFNWLGELARAAVRQQPALAPLADGWLDSGEKEKLSATRGESGQQKNPSVFGGQETLSREAEFHHTGSRGSDSTGRRESRAQTQAGALTRQDHGEPWAGEHGRQIDDLAEQVSPWQEPEMRVTDWGGLFFLYTVMNELDLPRQLLEEPVLEQRAFGWSLYQLSALLVPTLQEETVSCVFAGVSPDEPLPWQDTPAISEAERAVLQRYARSMIDNLQTRLAWNEADDEMIPWLCRRPARLQLEPGWLKVVLPFDAIDTNIRRAMLDLNPGFIPWLGRVVEIVYE